ncbi:FAD dependent oxidoreductase [Sphaerosporella brunnea]|uniref:L-2-hydroxyglutarate dehydrogenase, mitochondrial n=1 Tax=Sphaerosporella brunnea TaxID=1250544 RepID=A0A5J5EJL2_9PEZI|nr:FAD dependent oxidoreductase [Sphaerosporella brunnea]
MTPAATLLFRRRFSTSFRTRANDFTHCVIGGGIVGLAIARQLARAHPGSSTVLLERHNAVGTETSSRNSEVIHGGLYYPRDSLKTKLCIQGARMLYDYCITHQISHKRCGKWVVAQTEDQLHALNGIYKHATSLGVKLNWLSATTTTAREPHVRAAAGALESPNTGIVDSHALMQSLLGEFVEAGGDVALGTVVTALAPHHHGGGGGGGGYKITASSSGEETEITADVVVNAAGLGAIDVGNLILPKEKWRKAYYCKGTYYVPLSTPPPVGTLIYPAPVPGLGGLGTHLTMDMGGNFRFGPDVEWVDDPSDVKATSNNLVVAREAIKTYLPGIGELRPDYAGIRPKLKPRGEGGVGSVDFWIKEEEGHRGFVNLLGIESPGLTSSLAIAEYVDGILYK